jgi:hypothetical protein
MPDIAPVAPEHIERRIYLVRGQRVMLDRDLAAIYEVETRVLNQAVKRNRERFPSDFMFSLKRDEIMRMSQIVISSPGMPLLKFSKNVNVFTEHGVAMLSSVLNSPRAIQVNIQVMRTFARLRGMLASHRVLAQKLAELEKKYDAQFKVVFEAIRQLMAPPPKPAKRIGFGRDESERHG